MVKYYIGYIYKMDTLVAFQSASDADTWAEEWVEVEADSLSQAFTGYEQAFQKWKERQG